MDFKKLSVLTKEELLSKKLDIEKQLKEELLNTSLTNMEKPHVKRELKISIAQINGLLSKGEN